MATLYVVGTPIGNLEDVTLRALDVLGNVDIIAAEDTRVTRRLLERFEIQKPLVTYTDAYDRKHGSRLQRVLAVLAQGQDVALVSDAGMPGLSDPGLALVQAALGAGHELIVVPGPSAVTAALIASGLATDRFLFLGFLPRKPTARRRLLAGVAEEPGSLIMFESPQRLPAALADLLEVMGNRPLAIAREMTKRFEEVWRGFVGDAVAYYGERPVKGEVTLVVGGAPRSGSGPWSVGQVRSAIELLKAEDMAPSAVARVVARLSGWTRSEVYGLM